MKNYKAVIMSFKERKNGIINGISQVSDEEVSERLEKIRKEEDWFDSLPLEVQKSVIRLINKEMKVFLWMLKFRRKNQESCCNGQAR